MSEHQLELDPLAPSARIIRIWDCETTGRPEDEGAEVIELGRLDLDLATKEIGNEWTALAKPLNPIGPETMAVHHIRNEDVADKPELWRLWAPFFEGLGENDILAAHRADFEQHFHSGNGRPWICTYKCSLIVWPDAPGHSNQVLRYWLDLPIAPELADPPHRALPDARVTALILKRLLDERTVDELVSYSKWPALLVKCNMGQHRGKLWRDVDSGFLEWVLGKDFDADTKFTCRYWLKKRSEQKP